MIFLLLVLPSLPTINSLPESKSIFSQKQPILPKDFQIGDLIFIESIPHFSNVCRSYDHVAMYIGENKFIEANDYSKIPPPLGGTIGVQITPLWKYKLWTSYCSFGRVKNISDEQRQAAVDWAMEQLGDDNFQTGYATGDWWANPNPKDSTDPHAQQWYCAELPWAAYYNTSQGEINLDVTPGPLKAPFGDGIHLSITPEDMIQDDQLIILGDDQAPSPPVIEGELHFVTLPQRGVYTATIDYEPVEPIQFQWVWGDRLGPEPWVPADATGTSSTQNHVWTHLTIMDRLNKNNAFDIRVRCKDEQGRIGPWSTPFYVHLFPPQLQKNWVTPSNYVDTNWIGEQSVVSNHVVSYGSVSFIKNETGWCQQPLVLTFDSNQTITGYRIKANHYRNHKQLLLKFYQNDKLITAAESTTWPHLRWSYVEWCQVNYTIDKVEIWIQFHQDMTINLPFVVRDFSLLSV